MVFEGSEEAKGNASGRCLDLFVKSGVGLSEISHFVADVGPGGFTGLRVGVMLVKTLAWTEGKPVAGIPSFDLVVQDAPVSLPAKKGSWIVREPGNPPRVQGEFSGSGYGSGAPAQTYPLASRASNLLPLLNWKSPHELMPRYVLEPSISLPKKAYLPGAVS